ncbi:hypothetical protein ACQ4PT_062870 [Festuca glaucescens]
MAASSKPPFLIHFGGKRLRKFVDNELSDVKRDVIATSCFADLARISQFHVPEELLEWVVMNIDPKLREYCHKRSFALLAFATVLFLGTNNMVPLDYLGSLLDMETVHEYAWDEAILAYCMDQVAEFQEKRRLQKEFVKQNPTERVKQFSIGSCLPALVIVYVDHLDFPVEQVHGHVFDYSLPRTLHVCNADFELVMAIDRNKKTLDIGVFVIDATHLMLLMKLLLLLRMFLLFKSSLLIKILLLFKVSPQRNYLLLLKLRLRHTRLMLLQLSQCFNLLMFLKLRQHLIHLQKLMLVSTVPIEFNAFDEKHKKLFKREINAALSSFGLVVQGIQCNRMALLLKDVSDAARNDSLQEGTNESNGINFDVPNLDPEACFHASVSMGGVGSSPAGATIIKDTSVGIAGGFGAVIGDAVVSNVLVQTVDCTKDSSVPPRAPSPTPIAAPRPPSPSPVAEPRPPSPTPIAADARLMDLSNKGAEGYEIFSREMTPTNSVHSLPSPIFQSVASATTPSPTRSAGPTAVDELTSGPSTHEKRTRHKRVAVDFDSAPKMKKVKVNADADALYTKYVLHKQKTKKPKEGDSYFDCGFFVILYMENFNGKIMKMFGQDYIPIFRKIVAAILFNKPPNEIDAAVAIAEQAP